MYLMKIYTLKRTQILPISLTEAWSFFSSPKNLAKITPTHMGFKILYISGGDKAYAGQIIRYHINVLPIIRVNWVTEITHVSEEKYFIDEQRFGPYALWHHQHHFRQVENGVEMTDEVNYAIPLGILGRLAHWLFVGREVNRIFEYRYDVLEKFFNKDKK
jgi:ligand-binding SRPBCC domain-containing protein